MGREPALFLDFSDIYCYPSVLEKPRFLLSPYEKNKSFFEDLQGFGLQYFTVFLATEDSLIDCVLL